MEEMADWSLPLRRSQDGVDKAAAISLVASDSISDERLGLATPVSSILAPIIWRARLARS